MRAAALSDDQLGQLVLSAQRRLLEAEALAQATPTMATRERLVDAQLDLEHLREWLGKVQHES